MCNDFDQFCASRCRNSVDGRTDISKIALTVSCGPESVKIVDKNCVPIFIFATYKPARSPHIHRVSHVYYFNGFPPPPPRVQMSFEFWCAQFSIKSGERVPLTLCELNHTPYFSDENASSFGFPRGTVAEFIAVKTILSA